MADVVFISKESFAHVNEDGSPGVVKAGARYAEGHPLLEKYPHMFEQDSVSEPNQAVKRGPGRPAKSNF